MRKRYVIVGLLTAAAGVQTWALQPRENPRSSPERSFERHLEVTPEVDALIRRACMDCHSNETRWPWYSRVLPVSWLIQRDVERGRKVMNFSDWPASKRPVAASMLMASCAAAQSGRMPRFPYSLIHPEARLSPADLATLCGWTRNEARKLMARNIARTND